MDKLKKSLSEHIETAKKMENLLPLINDAADICIKALKTGIK